MGAETLRPRRKKVAFTKPPITFAQQIDKLRDHGLEVPDHEKAEFYLSQLNYYRFSAYCLPFEQDHSTHQFRVGTRFNDVLNLYIFDRELRLLVLDAIERFEVSLRTQMAYHLCHIHDTAHPHLKPEIFFNPVVYGGSISKLSNDVRNSKEEFIKHLTGKYEELLPPLWAVVELMTMGQLSKWYTNIRERSDRQAIAQVYGVDERILTSFCKHLTTVRNICAHHARLWNRDFTVTMTLPKNGRSELVQSVYALPDADRRRRKLYNALVMLAHLMDVINPGHHWKHRLIQLIEIHEIDPRPMGFPADWRDRSIWEI